MQARARAWITGAAVGAGVAYLFDIDQGRRRRARLRDKAVHAAHKGRHGADTLVHDMDNRAHGLLASLTSLFRPGPCPDEVLHSRVRSQLGRLVSHPASIAVDVDNGHVILSGPVLAPEVEHLLERVRRIRGVRTLEDRLDIHAEPGNVPGLQGAPARRPEAHRFELLQQNWSPATRFLAGSAAVALARYGMRRGGALGMLCTATGAGLGARAATNMPVKRLVGLGVGPDAIEVHKTIHVAAPLDRVYSLWSNAQDFPKFMNHVRDVHRLNGNRWRWSVAGPGGGVSWDAVITRQEDNQVIGWRTEAGSLIQHAGEVKFRPDGELGTLVEIRLRYNPVVGAVGHAFAKLLAMDPQRILDHDLLRLKSYIETGQIPRDAAKRELAEAEAEARAHGVAEAPSEQPPMH